MVQLPGYFSHHHRWAIGWVGEWVIFCAVRCLGYPLTCMWVLWLCVPHGVCVSSICYALLGRKFNLCPNLTCHRCLFIQWPAPSNNICSVLLRRQDSLLWRIDSGFGGWYGTGHAFLKSHGVEACRRDNIWDEQNLLSELKGIENPQSSLNLWVCRFC